MPTAHSKGLCSRGIVEGEVLNVLISGTFFEKTEQPPVLGGVYLSVWFTKGL